MSRFRLTLAAFLLAAASVHAQVIRREFLPEPPDPKLIERAMSWMLFDDWGRGFSPSDLVPGRMNGPMTLRGMRRLARRGSLMGASIGVRTPPRGFALYEFRREVDFAYALDQRTIYRQPPGAAMEEGKAIVSVYVYSHKGEIWDVAMGIGPIEALISMTMRDGKYVVTKVDKVLIYD